MNHPWYLVAHVVNATSIEDAIVEFAIAKRDAVGDWFNQDGWQIWPFWTQPIEVDLPTIPTGWINYLHREAARAATATAKLSLSDLLGLSKPTAPAAPIPRRL